MSVVNFNVGGYKCSVDAADLSKHPNSLLSQLSKTASSGQFIHIDREGELFKYVNAFLVNGQLPRDRQGALALEAPLLEKLRLEADFYRLDALKKECDEQVEKPPPAHLPVYQKMRSFITGMGSVQLPAPLCVVHDQKESPLIQALHNSLEPAYAMSEYHARSKDLLVVGGNQWKVQDLLQLGKVDNPSLTERDSFDLIIESLNAKAVDYIGYSCVGRKHDIFPRDKFELKPMKLSVHTSSGPEIQCNAAEYTAGQIGTLIVFLPHDYTGGGIHVRSDDQCEDVLLHEMGWIAMHSVCSYQMDRVTSGTRVTLLYNIMRTESIIPRTYYNVWYNQYGGMGHRIRYRTTISEPAGAELLSAVDAELANTNTIMIAMQYVYSANACKQNNLKGGDRALYDLLCEHYDVQVVCTCVYHSHTYYDDKPTRIEGAILTPDIIREKIATPTAKKSHHSQANSVQGKSSSQHCPKLFLRHELKSENVMHFIPCTEWGLLDGEAVYLVSGLRVSKKL